MLNEVRLIGNLGNDPEVRVGQSGTKVARLSVATNERWTDKDGKRQEHTEWHRVVCFGQSAEFAEKYLGKGRRVHVSGKLRTSSWEGEQGETRYSTEIVAQRVLALDSAGNGNQGSGNGQRPPQQHQPASDPWGQQAMGAQRGQGSTAGREDPPDDGDLEDDIPF